MSEQLTFRPQENNSRRLRRVSVTPEFLLMFFGDGERHFKAIANIVPEGVRIANCYVDHSPMDVMPNGYQPEGRFIIWIVISHPSFEEVPDMADVPDMDAPHFITLGRIDP